MNITYLASGFFSLLSRINSNELSESADIDGGVVTIIRVIIAMMLGVILASLWSIYDKKYLGGFVRKLISEGCTSADSAKTLYELGYDDKLGVRLAIRRQTTFYRWVKCVEEDKHEQMVLNEQYEFELAHKDEEKPPKFKWTPFEADLDTDHYYIPEELREQAEAKFSAKGANLVGIFIVLIIIAIILGISIFFLPKILSLILSLAAG